VSDSRTEITMLAGEPVVVDGDVAGVESAILAAARGSIMELVWLPESGTGRQVGVNPEHVVALRPAPAGGS
jgi:hypothetical protein